MRSMADTLPCLSDELVPNVSDSEELVRGVPNELVPDVSKELVPDVSEQDLRDDLPISVPPVH